MKRVAVVLVLLLGALAGCRQAPADPGFPTPAPGREVPATPAQVTYEIPAGFIETDDYRPGQLYFPAPALKFLIPTDALGQFGNLEVITVISYLMDIDVSDWPEERIVELIRRMVARLGSPVVEPERVTVAGRPAYTLPVVEGSPLGRRLTYQATFIFDRTSLVQIQCQYDQRQQLVEQACAELHESLQITNP
jgi:hypothetical protein